MTRIFGCILLLGILSANISSAQKQADWWYFGLNAGVHFNPDPAAVTDGALYTAEGCSSISDSNGNLLFYTDGVTVYTKQHTIMPNSGDLMGDISSTQSALIVPTPGNPNQYYIFTVPAGETFTNGFRYSIVDLTLNGGLGDVTLKNVFVKDNVTEKLSGVGNDDGSGYWIMVHEWGTDAFRAYQLTSSGFNTNAIVSHSGSVHSKDTLLNATGQLKFSPDGKKVVVAIGYAGLFELFDFDNVTGIVSNPISLATNDKVYGVEFSPDNSKIYGEHYSPFYDQYYIDQYDISSGNASTIKSSKKNISTTETQVRAMQLGPDKKVYVAMAFTGALGVINDPDSSGSKCNYQASGLDLGGKTCALGLPGFVQSYFKRTPPVAAFAASDTTICANSCISFTDLSSNNPDSWQWTFPGSDSATSSLQNPSGICFHDSGSYIVQLIASNADGSDTAQMTITVLDCSPPTAIFFASQNNFCSGTCIDFMDSSQKADSYLWTFNGGIPHTSTEKSPLQICFDTAGNYVASLKVTNAYGTDSMGLSIRVNNCDLLLPDAFSPNDDGINDIFHVLGNAVATIDLQIWNRWGQMIFETKSSDKESGWHGDYKGVPQPVGVYVYVLHATMKDGTSVMKKGNVTLLR